jgi:peptidoglycan hydrolase-like protein with peptidoglycan-binding domain
LTAVKRLAVTQRRSAVCIVALTALLAAWGCTSSARPGATAQGRSQPSEPVSTASTTSTSPPTTSGRLPGLQMGDSGPVVLAMEQRLAALHYDVGTPDGHFGPADQYAVIAFEKVHGMDRTGRATDDVVAAMASAADPAALVPTGGAMRVEIDVPRQVLFLYVGNQLNRILPVSTGSGAHYCQNGDCGVAVTPGGSFRIFRKILGLQISPLGQLYNPLYFNGGIAIHGEPSVPSYPASHGCVRIPMNSSLWFYNLVPDGTPVYVVGGPAAPVPLNAQAPGPPPPPQAPTPASVAPVTTTVPPTTEPSTTTVAPTTTSVRPTTTTAPAFPIG